MGVNDMSNVKLLLKRMVFVQITSALIFVSMVVPSYAQSCPNGCLWIEWAGIIDNGEGSGGIHGPYGSIHIVVRVYLDGKLVHKHKVYLHGVTNTGDKFEWDDGDQRLYANKNSPGLWLHKWMHPNEEVGLTFYESDPAPSFIPGFIHGREHDVLMNFLITRRAVPRFKPARIIASKRPAKSDAIKRSRERNGNKWAKRVWNGGIRQGIPSMFIKIKTY